MDIFQSTNQTNQPPNALLKSTNQNINRDSAGVSLEKLDNTFIEMIKASVDKPLPITVYNYKSMTKR